MRIGTRLFFYIVFGKSGPSGAAMAQFVGFRFQVSGVSAAAGQKSGQFDRERNFEKANNESSSGGL